LAAVGRWLGIGLAGLSAALDPGTFVIGGGVSDAGELLLGPTREAYRRTLVGRGHRAEARIVRAELGNEAGLVGAADLARDGRLLDQCDAAGTEIACRAKRAGRCAEGSVQLDVHEAPDEPISCRRVVLGISDPLGCLAPRHSGSFDVHEFPLFCHW